jgi:L-alanine-DL-glutamate epimerase-like enolase superfamily enzyme
MSCSYSSSLVPVAEYLMLVGEASQYFLKTPCRPLDGYFTPPEASGIGLDIDESKVYESFYMEA